MADDATVTPGTPERPREGGPLAQPEPLAQPPPTRNPLKRLYRWILSWAHHPMGTWMLGLFAFLDSSVFPIPPLFLQVALSLERPRRAWWYATVNTLASCAGAVLGYMIGRFLYDTVGVWVIRTYSLEKEFAGIGGYLNANAFAFILVYSFVPFPYKVITIGSGVFRLPLLTLLGASMIGRGFRFFVLAFICWRFGAKAATFIEKYFNWVMLGIALLVACVVLVMKLWLGR